MSVQSFDVIPQFRFEGTLLESIPFGNGHINDTYRLTFAAGETSRRYILQRLNTAIFTKPQEVMENIEGVTAWLKKKIIARGGDPSRETLNLIPTVEGNFFYVDEEGGWWRAFGYIEGAVSYDQVRNDQDFYESAVTFGNFQCLLADYPAATLHETIADFHNTADRFAKFQRAVEADVCGRAASVQPEIRFVQAREAFCSKLVELQKQGVLPLRVTHNDTKLNNIMIDDTTGRGICVIDLDTVMPGLSVNDFGDSIRFGASTAAEDETDLEKVSCDLHLFEVYTKGFLEGCGGALTQAELDALVDGAKMMTLECGIRFLTDYLEGDHYFKIHREQHNLDRCRTQFKLVADMEQKENEMRAIVARCLS